MKAISNALILALASAATQASPFMPWMPDMQQVLNQVRAAAPVEQLPGVPAPVFKLTQSLIVDGKLMQTMDTLYNQPKKQVKLVGRSVSPSGQESYVDFISNSEYQYVFSTAPGSTEVTCSRRPAQPVDSRPMSAEYIKSEFLDGKLVQKFKLVDSTPAETFLWVDASTGVPVHFATNMNGQKIETKFSDYTIFIDESEFNIPKRLVCQSNAQLFDELTAGHFMKHPARLF